MSSPHAATRTDPALITGLVWTMVFSTVQLYTIAVLASEIRVDLDISRTQIGLIGAANTGIGAIVSPFTGRVIDRIGAKQGAMGVLIGGALGMFATAAAPNYQLLLAASVIAGVAQSGGNPATNKLISLHVADGRRGVVTGLKQSGVTLSLFLTGLTLPGASSAIGWRTAVSAYGCLSVAFAALLWVRLPADPSAGLRRHHRDGRHPLPGFVRRITTYAFLMGVTTAGILRFLPLFAEEELGYSDTVAGLAAALVGLVGIGSRITWGRLAEHHVGTRTALTTVAALSALTAGLLALAPDIGAWMVWPIAVLTAGSAVAWNVIGNLAVIRGVPSAAAGRATGTLLFGFLAGLSLGAPMTGAIVDATDDYTMAWLAVGIAAVAAACIIATSEEPPVVTGNRDAHRNTDFTPEE